MQVQVQYARLIRLEEHVVGVHEHGHVGRREQHQPGKRPRDLGEGRVGQVRIAARVVEAFSSIEVKKWSDPEKVLL